MIQNIDLIKKNIYLGAAIVNANNELSILSAKNAFELGLINPYLIGNINIIKKILININWSSIEEERLISSNSEAESAEIACKLASSNKVRLIVKGHMHSDIMMAEYIKSEHQLLTKGVRMSHLWLLTFDDEKGPLIITDGALNIMPSLRTKQSIVRNSINFSVKLDNFKPKVAILSATEKTLDSLASSLEAEKIERWAQKEFPDIPVSGPLAFDNAISLEAAQIKGNVDEVTGHANILVMPNIETGNAIVKVMVNYLNATAGGFVVGSKVPVVITSRSHNIDSRISSICNAILSMN